MAFCSSCGADLGGQFCAKCGAQALAIAPAGDWRTDEQRDLDRRAQTERHGIPALLSFFIPGLGQMIKGRFALGAAVMFAALVFAALCAFVVGIPMLAVLWIWQIYDAYVKPDASLLEAIDRAMIRSRSAAPRG